MTAPLMFKVLAGDHKSVYQSFDYTPYLPKNEAPGKALPKRKKLILCESGWHATVRPELHWRPMADLYVFEPIGKYEIGSGDKITCESGRLVAEVTNEWPWLPLFPVVRLLLASSWKQRNPDAEKVPDWAYLVRADLSGAYLSGAYLVRADLSGADLYGANLTGATLTGANLTGATLTGANLTGANLTGATLTGANLTGATLTGANLTGANLSGANLTGANLVRADLTGANLSGAYGVALPVGWRLSESGLAVRT